MKKAKYFLLGFLITAVVFSSAPALASAINAALNGVNITYNGNAIATTGKNYTLPNGQQTPFSILYNGTTYLPVRKVSEILNVPIGWDNNAKTVKIGNDATQTTTAKKYKVYSDKYPIPDFQDIFGCRLIRELNPTDSTIGLFVYSTDGLPSNVTEKYKTILESDGWKFLGIVPNPDCSDEYYNSYAYLKEINGKEYIVSFGYGFPSTDCEYEVFVKSY